MTRNIPDRRRSGCRRDRRRPGAWFNGGVPGFDGTAYQARLDALAAAGQAMHGEADLVSAYRPSTVLDAGCGTGRVALELARRGLEVVGVDYDQSMMSEGRRQSVGVAGVTWVEADLSGLRLGRLFDVVVLAGNVPLFCPPGNRPALVESCAAHVAPAGVLIAGFALDGRYELSAWDDGCTAAGLILEERWSTWDRQPFSGARGDYAVSVHRRLGPA